MDFSFDRSLLEAMHGTSSHFEPSYWREVCSRSVFPDEYWNALAKAGLFGVMVRKKWGGLERGLVDLALLTQETAERFAGAGSYLYLSGSLTPMIFERSASDEMKRKLLPLFATGKVRASIALSEEGSGLDSLSMLTTAVKRSDHFVIEGTKTFVTNADRSDYLLVFARTSKPEDVSRAAQGISMFLVDATNPGIEKRKMEKLGLDFNTLFSMKFSSLKADSETLVGELGRGWYAVRDIFDMDRILTSASLVGTGKLAVNQASNYAKGRKVFGKAIGANQGVQFSLADAIAQLITAEVAMTKAASLVDAGRSFADDANIAFLLAETAANTATDRALQAFGGHGYLKENDVERYWRDARVHRFHPVSEELVLATLAHKCLGLPRSF